MAIELPAFDWHPRAHQERLWRYLESGGKRGVAIWHRRAGKDDVALNWAAVSAFERVGNYWHMLPEAAQARKAIWQAVNPHSGRRRIDEAFPAAIRANTNEQEMFIRFVNGSTWQVVGSDNYNSLVGATPVGIVFSEWALANPSAWAFMRPILLENGGWALFITTPRGRNHASSFYEGAKDDPLWYAEKLTAAETSVFTPQQLEQELKEYIREFGEEDGQAKYDQEYDCSFDAAVQGSYYGKIMQWLEDEGRIGSVPYNPSVPVYTSLDIGVGDSTVIWFAQQVGGEVRLIDLAAASGEGADWYAKTILSKPYIYKQHLVPHDAAARDWGAAGAPTRIMTMRSLGVNPIRMVPIGTVDDGISATRAMLRRSRFNRETTQRGIEALQQYRKSWDEANKVFRSKPLHDWSSDYADSLRYLSTGLRDKEDVKPELAVKTRRLLPSGTASWMGG